MNQYFDQQKNVKFTIFHQQISNMGNIRFGVDGDGNYGYYGADDSLIPFKSGCKLIDYSLWRFSGSFTKTFTNNDKFTECYILLASVNAGSDPYVNYTPNNVDVEVVVTRDTSDSGSGFKFRSKILKLTNIKEGSSITMSVHWASIYALFA